MQRIVLLNVRLIVQNYQRRKKLEKHVPIYDHKKSEAKNKSYHKRRIKIDSVEDIILRRVLLRKKNKCTLAVFMFVYIDHLKKTFSTREEKFNENGVTNLQISLETILFEMVRTYIKSLVFWKLAIVVNILKPLLAKRFILFLRSNLIKTYVWVVCRSVCTADCRAAHHVEDENYEWL